MLKAWFKKYQLQFTSPVLTSRGSMAFKNGYFLFITDGANTGTGECSFIEGLSIDDLENYESTLTASCNALSTGTHLPDITHFPSLRFGLEMAQRDLQHGGRKILYPGTFTDGKSLIPINGLVWMGSKEQMHKQIQDKLNAGFKCIKIKVGAIDFDDEVMLLDYIRQKFGADVIELRLDANGAFNVNDVFEKLQVLSEFEIHSIEQPVKQGQYDLMAKVCANSPIPVALDEELIKQIAISKEQLITHIKPQYIILKPSLLGGFKTTEEWIHIAEQNGIAWWATSALESNVGLNAIAQWVFSLNNPLVQGLGTGGLYTNNIQSPLYIQKGELGYNPAQAWGQI